MNLKHKINKQVEQIHRSRECFDSCQMGGELGDGLKKVRGLRNTDQLLQNSHEDVKYSRGNTVNNIITMYADRWL